MQKSCSSLEKSSLSDSNGHCAMLARVLSWMDASKAKRGRVMLQMEGAWGLQLRHLHAVGFYVGGVLRPPSYGLKVAVEFRLVLSRRVVLF